MKFITIAGPFHTEREVRRHLFRFWLLRSCALLLGALLAAAIVRVVDGPQDWDCCVVWHGKPLRIGEFLHEVGVL